MLSVGFSTQPAKEASGVSILQQCATRDCSARGAPFTTAGRGTGTSKGSLAPARVQIAPGPFTTDRSEERGARLLASVTVGKAPPDFLVGRLLDALHKEAGGVSVLQHSAFAASVSQT
jgi:hypothetical protein